MKMREVDYATAMKSGRSIVADWCPTTRDGWCLATITFHEASVVKFIKSAEPMTDRGMREIISELGQRYRTDLVCIREVSRI